MIALDRVALKIERSKRYVFERKDFEGIASYAQVGRALKQLVEQHLLIKIGFGLYIKARLDRSTGESVPILHPEGLNGIIKEIFKMRGIKLDMNELAFKNVDEKTSSSPPHHVFWNTKKFKRKLSIG
ncbi:S-adenosylhomocysteine hydrolase [Photobacterium damselae]|uniref:S-adenosylhomocysteine hydrolase n=1 Tax=Photobacterium damselae TaxID=38293 RepID=UPI00370C71B9